MSLLWSSQQNKLAEIRMTRQKSSTSAISRSVWNILTLVCNKKKVPQDNLGKLSLTEPKILDNLQMSGPLWTVFLKWPHFFSIIDGFDWFTLQKYMYHTPNFIHLQACNPRLQMMWHWLFQNYSFCSHIKQEAAHVVVARSPGQQCGSFN